MGREREEPDDEAEGPAGPEESPPDGGPEDGSEATGSTIDEPDAPSDDGTDSTASEAETPDPDSSAPNSPDPNSPDPVTSDATATDAADSDVDATATESDDPGTDAPSDDGSGGEGPRDDSDAESLPDPVEGDDLDAADLDDEAELDGAADGSEEVVADGATATGGESATSTGGSSGLIGGAGPEEDREMPLADHIEEMLKRLAVVVAVAGLVSLLVFPFAEVIINFLWYSILPGVEADIARPRLYGVLELVFTKIKVASLAGLIVALPVLVYETYAFMRPGLYPHERRYYLAAIPTSLVLALVGVSFAYFVVLPAIFVYFLYYSQDVATIGFALGRTFDLILLLMGYMAIVFQIPLFILLAMMMGLTSRRWLAERRLIFWGAFLGISFLFSPDPTGMAPILVAITMITLFEGTLLLTKWTGRG